MILNAEMMLRSALFRTESRGSHYREDCPGREDPSWLAWVKVNERQGEMVVEKEPEDCFLCLICELDCPKHAIYVSPSKNMPATLV